MVFIVGFIAAAAIAAGVFVAQIRQKAMVEQQQNAVQLQVENFRKEENKNQKEAEIESIKDLIDGDYEFENVDTLNWRTYQNKDMGFEVKIPENWEAVEASYKVEGKETKKISLREKGLTSYVSKEGGAREVAVTLQDTVDAYKDISFRDQIEGWEGDYNFKAQSFKIDNSQAVIANFFGVITTIFFVDSKVWNISAVTAGNPNISKNYSGIIKSFKFLNN